MVNLTQKTTKKDTYELDMHFEETGVETVEMYPLQKLDWVKMSNELGEDVKQRITGKFRELAQKAEDSGYDIENMSDEDLREFSREQGEDANLFSDLNTREQLYMYYYAFRKVDEGLAEMDQEDALEIVSDWTTNAIKSQEQYYGCLTFLFYGKRQERLEEEAEQLEKKKEDGKGKADKTS